MVTAIIVQARLGSSRLPAKVLLPLPNGRKVVEEVLNRCRLIDGVDRIVLAIPDTAENDILAGLYYPPIHPKHVVVVRGPEHDVLARYAKAAKEVGADVVMRVTSDCPLIDPGICEQVLSLVVDRDIQYASNAWPSRHFPHGLDCEVFTAEALYEAQRLVGPTYTNQREHVGPAIRSVVPVQKQACLKAMDDNSHVRWTLDTLADYVAIWNVFRAQMAEAA